MLSGTISEKILVTDLEKCSKKLILSPETTNFPISATIGIFVENLTQSL